MSICSKAASSAAAGLLSAKQQDAAKALANFLTSEAAVPVKKKLGLDPA